MASPVVPPGGVNGGSNATRAFAIHMEILLARLDPQGWLKLFPPIWQTFRPEWQSIYFVNFVLPLLMYCGARDPLRSLVHDHPWLASCTTPSRRQEDARIFNQDPTRNAAVLQTFLKLQLCKIFGSELRRHTVCGVLHQYYLSALEMKVWTPCSKDAAVPSSEATKHVVDISSTDDAYMQSVYGESWRCYCSRTEDGLSGPLPDPILGGELHDWSWINPDNYSKKKGTEGIDMAVRQAVQRFLDQPGEQIHPSITAQSLKTKRYELADFCKRFEEHKDLSQVCHEVFSMWLSCYDNAEKRSQWNRVLDSTGQFCLAAGSPKASNYDGPFQHLQHLRKTLSLPDLHRLIIVLRTRVSQQRRAITALAYQRVLENITSKENGRKPAEKWTSFLRNRVFDGGNGLNIREGTEESNPKLYGVLKEYQERYHGQPHMLWDMIHSLHSALDDAIYDFRRTGKEDQYVISSNQFSPLQRDLLLALKPLEDNVAANGIIDWEQEQKRYPISPHLISHLRHEG
ncbi:hypothetical protein GGR53DRAFT_282118 [Hypoxylon sp. FL1150]|nr:hypothetical protein GGR53DRAFT_282118 [Hypoxylon sp. FL1150]